MWAGPKSAEKLLAVVFVIGVPASRNVVGSTAAEGTGGGETLWLGGGGLAVVRVRTEA